MLHQHAVKSIPFIARDAMDARSFAYIHSSPDKVHYLYAIKTEATVRINYCWFHMLNSFINVTGKVS